MITIIQIRLGCTGLDKFFLKNICELKDRVIFIQLSQNKKRIVIVNGTPATESEYQLIYKWLDSQFYHSVFTNISMYSKLCEASRSSYTNSTKFAIESYKCQMKLQHFVFLRPSCQK